MAVLVGHVATHQRFIGPHKWAAASDYCSVVETLLRTEGFLLPSSLELDQTMELLGGIVVARKGQAADVMMSGSHAGEEPDYVLLFPDIKLADEQQSLQVGRRTGKAIHDVVQVPDLHAPQTTTLLRLSRLLDNSH